MLLPLEEVFIAPNSNTPFQISESIALEPNTVISARARTQTTTSGVQRPKPEDHCASLGFTSTGCTWDVLRDNFPSHEFKQKAKKNKQTNKQKQKAKQTEKPAT